MDRYLWNKKENEKWIRPNSRIRFDYLNLIFAKDSLIDWLINQSEMRIEYNFVIINASLSKNQL